MGKGMSKCTDKLIYNLSEVTAHRHGNPKNPRAKWSSQDLACGNSQWDLPWHKHWWGRTQRDSFYCLWDLCAIIHAHCTVTDDANHSLPPKMPCENRKKSRLNLNGSACSLALSFFFFFSSQRLELGQTCLSADVGRLWEHVFIPKALILCEELYWWAVTGGREEMLKLVKTQM